MTDEVIKDREYYDKLFDDELFPQIDALFTFAYNLTYDENDANDLVQETYLKAYRFIDKYQANTNPKAWLFRILKNVFINEYRKKSREPVKIDYDQMVAPGEEHPTLPATLDLREEIFNNLLGDEISAALNSLPVDYKTVILLCDIEGFSYEEIAEILEIPIGTVRSRLFRARNMLKQKLKNYGESLGYKDRRK
jgi:RNA polymerase sigma-70 factor (ECF subfamily)